MVIVVGVMVQVTTPIASLFLTVQHNITVPNPSVPGDSFIYFTNGWKDNCTVFFYFLIAIVVHAIILEYILDKVSRKMHLSKVKHSQFNESGQLLIFYAFSIAWGIDIVIREGYFLNIAALWEGYPHIAMTSYFKFFFIAQLSYWLHSYPELYFQKVKKEEMGERIYQATAYLVFIGLAYITNYTRVGLCLIVLHYLSEAAEHSVIMIDFFKKDENGSQVGQVVSKVAFVLVRLASIILSVLTFWYGLSLSDNQAFDFAAGNFNTQFIRMIALAAVGVLQAYLMWNFITSQLARIRELTSVQQPSRKKSDKKAPLKKKDKKRSDDDEVSDLPEVDQNTAKKAVRARAQKAK